MTHRGFREGCPASPLVSQSLWLILGRLQQFSSKVPADSPSASLASDCQEICSHGVAGVLVSKACAQSRGTAPMGENGVSPPA